MVTGNWWRKGTVLMCLAAAAVMPGCMGCDGTDSAKSTTENLQGPDVGITGPVTLKAGDVGTFTLISQGLGPGKPCPTEAAWSFTPVGSDQSTKVIQHEVHSVAKNGICTTSADPSDAPHAAHLFADTGAKHDVDVEVELRTNQSLDYSSGKKTVTVTPQSSVSTSGGQTPSGGGGSTSPTPQFGASADYPTSGHATGVVARDLHLNASGNPDGRASVAVSDDLEDPSAMDFIHVWPSKADGTLVTTGTPYGAGTGAGGDPTKLVSTDFDRDGNPDLAFGLAQGGGNPGAVQVFPSAGNGTFSSSTPIDVGAGPQAIATSGLTDPTIPDLLTANVNADSISVLQNDEGGVQGAFSAAQDFSTGSNTFPQAVAAGYIDGADFNPDLVVGDAAGSPGQNLQFMRNTSTGSTVSFATPSVISAYTGDTPADVAVGDINDDGRSDVVVANQSSDISVLINTTPNGNTTPSFTEHKLATGGNTTLAVAIGDFNHDTHLDVAAANHTSASVSVFLGDGTGSFGSPIIVPAGDHPDDVAAADVNGDHYDDLVVANYGTPGHAGSVTVALSNGAAANKLRGKLIAPTFVAAKHKARTRKLKASEFLMVQHVKLGKLSFGGDGTTHMKGLFLSGRLKAKLLGGRKARKGLPKGASDLLDSVIAGTSSADRYFDPVHANPIVARGLAVVRSRHNRKTLGCVKLSPVKAPAGQVPTREQLKLIGASGRAKGLTLSLQVPAFSLDVQAKTNKVTVTVGRGHTHGLSRACKKLVRKLPKH